MAVAQPEENSIPRKTSMSNLMREIQALAAWMFDQSRSAVDVREPSWRDTDTEEYPVLDIDTDEFPPVSDDCGIESWSPQMQARFREMVAEALSKMPEGTSSFEITSPPEEGGDGPSTTIRVEPGVVRVRFGNGAWKTIYQG
jgi:hypothetical protein